jgi:hypothetical protein
MSDQEDVKPKLNLNVLFEGNRTFNFIYKMLYDLITAFDALRSLEITVKVKATMRFAKIFEAAEVCQMCRAIIAKNSLYPETLRKRTRHVRGVYAENNDLDVLDIGTLRFTHDGQRLHNDDTPAQVRKFLPFVDLSLTRMCQLGMEDNDQIDAFIQQVKNTLVILNHSCLCMFVQLGGRCL